MEPTVEQVQTALSQFAAAREWEQFHTPENLAKSVAIEAGELLECFQWSGEFDDRHVREELADVLTYCFYLARRLDADPLSLILAKLEETERKYPAHLAKGRSDKYDQLQG